MALAITVRKPDCVLGKGTHAGYDWIVIHNSMGYRCGYVRVPKGHPWFEQTYVYVVANVHGGLTYSKKDVPTNKVDADVEYWWVGFDCAHAWDAPDPSLPSDRQIPHFDFGDSEVRDQAYVEAECRSLCEQAAEAASN